jgi:hypothetical protein
MANVPLEQELVLKDSGRAVRGEDVRNITLTSGFWMRMLGRTRIAQGVRNLSQGVL